MSTSIPSGSAKLTASIAWFVVLALLFPTFYTLSPANAGLLLELDLHSEATPHSHGPESPHDNGAHHHEADYSAVPGTPGHPADHNCTPCRVLKSLAGYIPQHHHVAPAALSHPPVPLERSDAGYHPSAPATPPSRAPPSSAV